MGRAPVQVRRRSTPVKPLARLLVIVTAGAVAPNPPAEGVLAQALDKEALKKELKEIPRKIRELEARRKEIMALLYPKRNAMQQRRRMGNRERYTGLPDISTFVTSKTDHFLVDLDDVSTGHPFIGANANRPHAGAHVYFDNRASRWPRGGSGPQHYPPIYAVADGIVTRIDYRFRQRTGNDRYGLDLTFARDAAGSGYRLCYSIEPMAPEPSPGFYKTFIQVEKGQRVRKGDVVAYMLTPPGVEHVHIHFHLMRTDGRDFMAPAVFTPDIVRRFHAKWDRRRGSDAGVPMPPCMGYRLGARENPFGTGPVDLLR